MATHSSILTWVIPWTEEPGKLKSIGSQSVRHNLATKPHHHHHLKFYTVFYVNYISTKLGVGETWKDSLQFFPLLPLYSYCSVAIWCHNPPVLVPQACVHAAPSAWSISNSISATLTLSLPAGFHLALVPLNADILAWRKSSAPSQMETYIPPGFKFQLHSSYSNMLRLLSGLSPSLDHQLLENSHCLVNFCLFCTSAEPWWRASIQNVFWMNKAAF